MSRDDFDVLTKNALAQRVGTLCSNPDCARGTSGPRKDCAKAVNVGVAAHITAASPGGPRYDESLSQEQRCAVDNGIWLCQTCAKLIDNDPQRFTVEVLRQWKKDAEKNASLAIVQSKKQTHESDVIAIDLSKTKEMTAQILDLLKRLAVNSSSTAPTYSDALAVIAAEHKLSSEELRKVLLSHAKGIANGLIADLDSARATLAAGQFELAEQAAKDYAVRLEGTRRQLEDATDASKSSEIDAWELAGLAAFQAHRFGNATIYFERCAKLTNKEENICRWLDINRELAGALMGSGRSNDALKIYLEIIQAQKPTESKEKQFDDFYNFGTVLLNCGYYEQAEQAFSKCFHMAEKDFDRTNFRLILPILSIGQVKVEQGDLQHAEVFIRKYLGHTRETRGLDNLYGAVGLYMLGKTLRLDGQLDEAYRHYETALKTFHSCLPSDHPQIALCENEIGLLYLQKQSLKTAEMHIYAALTMAEKYGDDGALSQSSGCSARVR